MLASAADAAAVRVANTAAVGLYAREGFWCTKERKLCQGGARFVPLDDKWRLW